MRAQPSNRPTNQPNKQPTNQPNKQTNTQIGVSVWDTAGQDRFSSLTPFYFRGAQGVVYVYDVTRAESLTHLRDKWMEVGGWRFWGFGGRG